MRFQYQGLQADGRLVSGLIDAVSERGAHRELVKRGVRPTVIAVSAAPRELLPRRRRRITRRDYANALHQLHALVAGGVPIVEAVTALGAATDHAALSEAYDAFTTALRRGDTFPRAFARCFPALPPHILRIIEAGELSGRLAEALADGAAELAREAKLRTELRQTLLYPGLLVVFGVLAVVFIFLIVVPRFAAMFAGKLDQLPLLSYLVIGAGMWFRAHLVLVLVILAGLAGGTAWAAGRPRVRDTVFNLAARLPLLRRWLAEIEVARWAAVVARLLENRVPLIQSLELARGIARRRDMQLRLERVERDVRGGAALATALSDSASLTPAALAMIRVGERAGSLPEMVRAVAALYDERVRDRGRMLLTIIEPVAILLIGAVIGTVAIAVFLAITSINKVPGL